MVVLMVLADVVFGAAGVIFSLAEFGLDDHGALLLGGNFLAILLFTAPVASPDTYDEGIKETRSMRHHLRAKVRRRRRVRLPLCRDHSWVL